MINSARLFVLAIAIAIGGCSSTQNWHLLYKNDRDGSQISGQKAALINAIRQGCKLRVGWGTTARDDPKRSIEHLSDPLWISIRNGVDVQIQLDEHLINHARLDNSEQATDKTGVMWRVMMNTQGEFDAIWYQRDTGELIRRVPQRHIISWFADCRPTQPAALFSGGKPR